MFEVMRVGRELCSGILNKKLTTQYGDTIELCDNLVKARENLDQSDPDLIILDRVVGDERTEDFARDVLMESKIPFAFLTNFPETMPSDISRTAQFVAKKTIGLAALNAAILKTRANLVF